MADEFVVNILKELSLSENIIQLFKGKIIIINILKHFNNK
jgi:hypothetical protein